MTGSHGRPKQEKEITIMNALTQFKKISILPLLIGLAFVAIASPTVARGDAVTDWNMIASNAIVVTAGHPPPALYPPAPGIWRPTPPNFGNDPAPWVGNVLTFIVPSAEMLRTDGPNALTSADYAEDFNEVKEVGSLTSTTRTADETDAAIF